MNKVHQLGTSGLITAVGSVLEIVFFYSNLLLTVPACVYMYFNAIFRGKKERKHLDTLKLVISGYYGSGDWTKTLD